MSDTKRLDPVHQGVKDSLSRLNARLTYVETQLGMIKPKHAVPHAPPPGRQPIPPPKGLPRICNDGCKSPRCPVHKGAKERPACEHGPGCMGCPYVPPDWETIKREARADSPRIYEELVKRGVVVSGAPSTEPKQGGERMPTPPVDGASGSPLLAAMDEVDADAFEDALISAYSKRAKEIREAVESSRCGVETGEDHPDIAAEIVSDLEGWDILPGGATSEGARARIAAVLSRRDSTRCPDCAACGGRRELYGRTGGTDKSRWYDCPECSAPRPPTPAREPDYRCPLCAEPVEMACPRGHWSTTGKGESEPGDFCTRCHSGRGYNYKCPDHEEPPDDGIHTEKRRVTGSDFDVEIDVWFRDKEENADPLKAHSWARDYDDGPLLLDRAGVALCEFVQHPDDSAKYVEGITTVDADVIRNDYRLAVKRVRGDGEWRSLSPNSVQPKDPRWGTKFANGFRGRIDEIGRFCPFPMNPTHHVPGYWSLGDDMEVLVWVEPLNPKLIPRKLTAEEKARVSEADKILHPDGRCTCAGEGRCDWCRSHCLHCGGKVPCDEHPGEPSPESEKIYGYVVESRAKDGGPWAFENYAGIHPTRPDDGKWIEYRNVPLFTRAPVSTPEPLDKLRREVRRARISRGCGVEIKRVLDDLISQVDRTLSSMPEPPEAETQKSDCDKCGGAGWVCGDKLDPPEDQITDQRYWCPNCKPQPEREEK